MRTQFSDIFALISRSRYFKKQGLSRPEVLANQSHYGTNSLAIAQPKFLDLFKQQLVSPIAMFQFFTSLLWLMDEYV